MLSTNTINPDRETHLFGDRWKRNPFTSKKCAQAHLAISSQLHQLMISILTSQSLSPSWCFSDRFFFDSFLSFNLENKVVYVVAAA